MHLNLTTVNLWTAEPNRVVLRPEGILMDFAVIEGARAGAYCM